MPIRYRLATDIDIEIYGRWFADPELARRLSAPTPEWHEHLHRGDSALWVALDTETGPLAVFQTEADEYGRVWFDCAIDPRRRGRGLMGAILRGWLEGPLADALHVIAEIEPDNAASLALLVHCGFAERPEAASPGFRRFELARAGQDG